MFQTLLDEDSNLNLRDGQVAISYAVGKFECALCPDVLEIPEMLQGCFDI